MSQTAPGSTVVRPLTADTEHPATGFACHDCSHGEGAASRAGLPWNGDLPRPLQQILLDTADGLTPPLAGAGGLAVRVEHPFLGPLELLAGACPDGTIPVPLFCENETNLVRLYGAAPITPYPKDGIGEHVIHGAATVNPDQRGTKCAFWYRLTVAPGETAELRLRLRPAPAKAATGSGGCPARRPV